MSNVVYWAALAASMFGLALALAALLRTPRKIAQWSFAAGLTALSVETIFIGCSLAALNPEAIARWQMMKLLALACVPGPFLLFSLSYSRGNYREFLAKWRLLLALTLIVPLLLALAFPRQLVLRLEKVDPTHQWFLVLGWPGSILYLLVLLSSIATLMNLERTFRASVGTMRWRIKFLVMGVALLCAVRVYTTSQTLLYSAINLSLQNLHVFSLWLACGLISVSYWRAGLFHVEVYPSQSVIRHSITVVVAGVYLLVVGVLANLVAALGGDEAFWLKALLVLVSLIGLSLLLLSDRIRDHTRRFVSRHFQRPHYDYRRVWSTFTERTASLMDRIQLCRAVTQWVAENFNALSVTIWLVEELRGQLAFGASTVLAENQAARLLAGEAETAELIRALSSQPDPVVLDTSREKWVATLKRSNPEVFGDGKTGNRVCVPLVAKGDLLGVMIAGDRVNGILFTVEDLDLLKCIGEQIAGNLLNLQLSQKLLQAKELEAFQTMSAFFVHDLKNTASTLSLMLQNLPAHFADPAFREDALRGLGKSVTRINELISRLSALRQELVLKPAPTDLNAVVAKALEPFSALKQVKLAHDLRPVPKLSLDAEQMQKVVANLLINALEAITEQGEIRVATECRNGWAIVSVADNGCGMAPEFIARSLFRPFQTTKKKGIGIGMFLSKSIVEAHRGKIEVESRLGKGTTFSILLPLQDTTP